MLACSLHKRQHFAQVLSSSIGPSAVLELSSLDGQGLHMVLTTCANASTTSRQPRHNKRAQGTSMQRVTMHMTAMRSRFGRRG